MHTHSREAPLSADAILDNYLAQQQQQTLKRNQTTAFKQVPLQTAFLTLKPVDHSQTKQQQQQQQPQRTTESKKITYQKFSHQHNPRQQDFEPSSLDDALSPEASSANNSAESNTIVHVQRKLLAFFYIYATIIISLYLTYAIYCYHQQSVLKRQQQQIFESTSTTTTPSTPIAANQLVSGLPEARTSQAGNSIESSSSSSLQLDLTSPESARQALALIQANMDDKLRLLERYIDVLALDLEDTKQRLREREKCACSIGCSLNGTRYADGQRWPATDYNKCDICTCRAGKISCAPRECPKLSGCESPVQLPGQCCPTCMKKCKLNQTLVPHGHTFTPNSPAKVNNGKLPATKQCKCYDGLIKCEQISDKSQRASHTIAQPAHAANGAAKNKTIEYLSSILSPQEIRVVASVPAATNSRSVRV